MSDPLPDSNPNLATRRVLVGGSSGLVGSALVAGLERQGGRVLRLVRGEVRDPQHEIGWQPTAGRIDGARLADVDAVVHLGGESIADGRWTAAKKERIRASRVESTRLLSQTLAGMARPPKSLVCASAIGFYGNRGEELLDETSRSGDDFLAEVCRQWEAATEAARNAGVRVVNVRLGVVLSPDGGALAKMLIPFKLGLGGVIGTGQQFMSWVALDDVVGAIEHALGNDALAGPVNLVSPEPVTNREFTKTLGKVLRRPTMFPMPTLAARLAFGEKADAILLSSTRVAPRRLQQAGYAFRFPQLEAAPRHVLR